jgi:hypothetical protein
VTALGAAVAVAVTAAGCVSMPTGGPVLPYATSQGGNGQAQPYLQFIPQPPLPNASPADIVGGFLAAGASFVGQQRVAREYLTPEASHDWKPGWSAIVFRAGPTVASVTSGSAAPTANEKLNRPSPAASPAASASAARQAGASTRATVTVGGIVQANLFNTGAYAVAQVTPKGKTYRYDLVRYHGQWRISNAWGNPLLLTSQEFAADYELRNLYFFDPGGLHLVPDPVYVPLQATQDDLVNGLVQELIQQPNDWLAGGATHTAFPKGTTQIGKVSVDGGTASVNLGGAMSRTPDSVKAKVSAQLLSTLSQSVTLYINGKAYVPDGAQGNPVQRAPSALYQPIDGSPTDGSQGTDFYYLDSHGRLLHQAGPAAKPAGPAGRIGTGYTSLAVSPDGHYLAALHEGGVYTGAVEDDKLVPRDAGGGFTSLSWDRSNNLWAAGPMSVDMMPAASRPGTGPVPVDIAPYLEKPCGSTAGGVTALQVAPDGVRVALVLDGQQPTLGFGAIVMQEQSRPGQQPVARVTLSPFFVCGKPGAFRSLSWYGANDVIALGQDGATLTRYPVNGGAPTTISGTIPGKGGAQAITARFPAGVIAAVGGTMFIDPGLTGVWSQLGSGLSPAYPG